MKKITATSTILLLAFLAVACNKAKPAATGTTPVALAPVALTQTYANKTAGYSYGYPTDYKIVTSLTYGKFSPVTANTINTDVQDTQTNMLVFVINQVPSMAVVNQQTVAARIIAEGLSVKNSAVTQTTVGSIPAFEVSDNSAADAITSDRYFVQNPKGKVFELLVVKDNPVAATILKSFSFTK